MGRWRDPPRPGTVLADKRGLHLLSPDTGAFCDTTRDAVKGPIDGKKAAVPGFVNGGRLERETLLNCIRGWTGSDGLFSAPSQTIGYLSCHDDWTLWDKLVLTMDPQRRFRGLEQNLLRANRLAAVMCFTCQGRPFLLSGEEFARTKLGVRDSVRSPFAVNALDWRRAWDNQGLVDYYRGLIALRKQLPGLCDKSAFASKRVGGVQEPAQDCVTLTVDNSGGDSPWKRLFLAYSVRREKTEIPLPEGEWELLADRMSSLLWQEPAFFADNVSLAPVSAAIFGQR